jgi:hypothetical protein
MMKKTVIVLAMLMMLVAFVPFASAYDNDPVEVDDDFYDGTDNAGQRNIVRFDNDTLLYVYSDFTTYPDIGYATSDDSGVTWDLHGSIGEEDAAYDPCIAKDSHDRVWCVYSTDNEIINITYYEDGVWSEIATVNVSTTDQYEPFVCVNSLDDIYVIWDENITDDEEYWQVFATNFTFAQFPDSIPPPVQISSDAIDQEDPTAAFDGNDTIHIVWECFDFLDATVNYSSREYGETNYEPSVDISPAGVGDGGFYDPSICVDDEGTVYVVCELRIIFSSYDLYVVYGSHPTGTDYRNLTNELDHNTTAYSLSCGWLNDELQIVYADGDTGYISYIHGTPNGGWEQEVSISDSVGEMEGYHDSPSIRWAYYNEEHTVVEYGFYDYEGMTMEDGGGEWLYYQQIHIGPPADDIADEITNVLIPMVMSLFMLVIVLAVIKGVVKSFTKMSK